MLKSIRISNFKRIDQNGIELEELAPVNYLVGENGCGKSSILEAIQYFYIYSPRNTEIEIGTKEICEILDLEEDENGLKLKNNRARPRETIINTTQNTDLHLDHQSRMFHPQGRISLCTSNTQNDLEKNTFTPVLIYCDGVFSLQNKYEKMEKFADLKIEPDFFKDFLSQEVRVNRSINLSELVYLDQNQNNEFTQDLKYKKLLKYLRHLLHQKNLESSSNQEEVAGQDIITKLALGILFLNLNFKIDLFLIEEPENNLHPKWQKKIPLLFDFLNQEFGFQFIVTTHSPFIISSSSQFTQDLKNQANLQERDFDAPQKVYFLADGSIASKRGDIETDTSGRLKGRFGYWGSKCVYIASKMLGAGIMDLIGVQTAILSHDAPRIIFCEGEGNDEDAVLYNLIFKDLNPPVLFISARGSSQLYRTFQVIKEIKKGLAANFSLSMVRDRDHEFPSENDILNFEHDNPGMKILRRRAIECYLFSSETAQLYLKKQNKKLDPGHAQKMDDLQAQIQIETEQGYLGNDYKYRLKRLFMHITFGYSEDLSDDELELSQDFKEQIASLITPQTETYRELFEVMFS
jgi:AAA15 family ATPase/GTPase